MFRPILIAVLTLVAAAHAYAGGYRCLFDSAGQAFAEADYAAAAERYGATRDAGFEVAASCWGAARAEAMLERRENALADLQRAFESGLEDPARAYVEPSFESIRLSARFRDLLAKHVRSADLTIAPQGEKGTRLRILGRVVDADGRPVVGARVYAYHTDAGGRYSVPVHDMGHDMGHDVGHDVVGDDDEVWEPRLFGTLTTDREGRFTLRTIRPGSYPGTQARQHVHVSVSASGYESIGSEWLFDDDPLLDAQQRAHADRAGYRVLDPIPTKGGEQLADVTVVLQVDR